MIPYGRQAIDKEDIKAVVEVLKSDWVTTGPKVAEFEAALCKYTGAKYAVAVSSGTAALHLACLAAEIKQGDEVITSPITFVASANCVLYCKGKPIFADIQEDTANIDPLEIRKKINKRTRAIIPVHFAGHPCDMDEVSSLAKKHGLTVIEDAAHALGAEYKGSRIGSCRYSDMAVFSFHPVKSITTGEGGAVLTNRKDLYQKLVMLRNHGIIRKRHLKYVSDGPWHYEMLSLGFNYRITDIQCALGLSQLKKLQAFITQRRRIASVYAKRLSELEGLIIPEEKAYVCSSWHLYPLRLTEFGRRRRVFEGLKKLGIGVQVHYIPVYRQPYYQRIGYKKGFCPKAEEFYRGEISIPIYPSMKNNEINLVINKICRILSKI